MASDDRDDLTNAQAERLAELEDGAPLHIVRTCVDGCGLAAAAGDIYCDGCRSGVEALREVGALR